MIIRTIFGKLKDGVLVSGPRHFNVLGSENFPSGVRGWWLIEKVETIPGFYFLLKFLPFKS